MTSLVSSTADVVARTNCPFGQAVTEVMRARHIGVRSLAREAGVSAGYLSRVLRKVDGKRASPELIKRIAKALDLPEDYFLETRRARIVALLEEDPRLVDEFERLVPAMANSTDHL